MENIKHKNKKAGFTIMEIMIVMIIISLVIGGVVAGRALVKAAQITATISDFNEYSEAVANFRNKYGYWPGDQADASNYWAGVQNGDGNSIVGSNSASTTIQMPSATTAESALAWQQLGLSGMIKSQYTGVLAVSSPHVTPGINAPIARISRATNTSLSAPVFMIATTNYASDIRARLFLSDFNATYFAGAITGNDSYAIDLKMDDGDPVNGQLRNYDISIGTCQGYTPNAYLHTAASECALALFLE